MLKALTIKKVVPLNPVILRIILFDVVVIGNKNHVNDILQVEIHVPYHRQVRVHIALGVCDLMVVCVELKEIHAFDVNQAC